MPHTLRTERLLLRQPRLRDARAIAQVLADFEVTKTTGTWPHPVTEDFARWRISRWLKRHPPEQIGFSIQHEQTIIGQIGVHRLIDRHYAIGWTIGKKWWGKGYGTEAARALCRHAFFVYGVRSIDAEIFIENPASIALAKKVGFAKHHDCGLCWSMTLQRNLPSVVYRLKNPRTA